ncbi:MAG: tetratricopeptide (TPR) repeat protein [Rhodothermales bacterium]|jgi:tetratricopeptide (TPR) repeat protein
MSMATILAWSIIFPADAFFWRKGNTPKPRTSKAQRLTDAEKAEADALAEYAWATHMSFSGDSDVDLVVNHFLNAVRADPDADFVLRELLLYLNQVRPLTQDAFIINELTPIAQKSPSSVGLNLLVANALLHEGRTGDAWTLLVKLDRLQDQLNPRILRESLVCLRQQRAYDRAHHFILTLGKRARPDDFEFQHVVAMHYHAAANSRRVASKRRQDFRKLATAHSVKAAELSDQITSYGDAMGLASSLLAGREVDKTIILMQALEGLELARIGSHQVLAECLDVVDRHAEALEIWQILAVRRPFNSMFRNRTAQNLRRVGRNREALNAFKIANRLDPRAETAFVIAQLHLLLGEPAAALVHAESAPPSHLGTYMLRSHCHRTLEQPSKAVLVLKDAASFADVNGLADFLTVQYYLTLARLEFLREGTPSEIVTALEGAIKLEPSNAEANNFLGYYLADRGEELERAAGHVERALKQEPDNAAFLDSLAWVYFQMGRFQEASANIERAIIAQGETADNVILDHAGDISMALGDVQRAIAHWERAIAMDHEEPEMLRQKVDNARKTQ